MYYIFFLVFTKELSDFGNEFYIVLISFGTVIFLISSLFLTRGFQLYTSVIALLIGHLIVFYYDLSFQIWHTSITKGIGMPLLFVVIPLISFPIKHGPYIASLESYAASKSKKPEELFVLLVFIHLIMSIVLNIGSISTLQKLIEKFKFPKHFLSLIYTAGYSSYMVFSPFDAVVNMVLLLTMTSYTQYFIGGSIMVISILAVALFLVKYNGQLRQSLLESLSHIPEKEADPKKVYELFVHIIIMIFLSFLSDKFLPFSIPLYGIAVVIILYSLIWGALIRKLGEYKKEFKTYSQNFLAFKGFLPFLISASFLGSLIPYTPLQENVSLVINYINVLPQYFIVQLLILVTMILSLCGIHMLITITVLAAIVPPAFIGLSSPAFALMLLSCWFISMSISPFVPFVVVVADTIKEKPFVISFKYNIRFAIGMLLLAPLIICGISQLM